MTLVTTATDHEKKEFYEALEQLRKEHPNSEIQRISERGYDNSNMVIVGYVDSIKFICPNFKLHFELDEANFKEWTQQIQRIRYKHKPYKPPTT